MVSINSLVVDKSRASKAEWRKVKTDGGDDFGYDDEEAGVVEEENPFRVLVRSRHTKDYEKARNKALLYVRKQAQKRGQTNDLDFVMVDSLAVAEACLEGWDGLEQALPDGSSKPIVFSKDVARKIMTDPDYHVVRDMIMMTVTEYDNAVLGVAEVALGN